MAIIQCPACKERISNKSKVCSYCNYNLEAGQSEAGENPEQLASKAKLAHLKQKYSLQMQAMASVILFLTGFLLWYFVGNSGLSEPSHYIEIGIAIVGAAWYLITRIRLMTFKTKT